MFKSNSLLKKIALLCTAVLILILFLGSLTPEIALSQQVESRLNALELDFRNLELQINQLESQLNQNRRGVSPRTPATSTPNNRGRNQPQLSREQMFDRLATLVIELKQQVNQLEARVSKLEPPGAPRNTR